MIGRLLKISKIKRPLKLINCQGLEAHLKQQLTIKRITLNNIYKITTTPTSIKQQY